MDAVLRIEQALSSALLQAEGVGGPPRLATALHYAVFPGGARIRPRICLAVAGACGADDAAVVDAASASIELLHCASLVHDDLPCFDDASTRRGKPSVHRAFGERLAVLSGDALIVLAFQTLARGISHRPDRLAPMLSIIARAVGGPAGIVAGQAWECEPRVALAEYQRAKTGALFVGSAMAGALAAGHEPSPWRLFGERLGEAFQVADDIIDVAADPLRSGKPGGRDAALGRPSAAHTLGLAGAVEHFETLVTEAIDAIPACPGATTLRHLMRKEADRLLPEEVAQLAA
jgi:geranylgeranyl diphosphate synthase type II